MRLDGGSRQLQLTPVVDSVGLEYTLGHDTRGIWFQELQVTKS